jgi:O-antigen/teichoic acid export membrane protein
VASVLEDLLSVARSKAAMIVMSLAKAIIIARLLGPTQNGLIAAIIVYPSLFMTIGSLGIRKSSAFLLGSGQYKEDEIKAGVFHLWILSSFFSILCIYFLILNTTKTVYDTHLILLAIAPVPFSLLNTYLSGIYLGNNNIKAFNQINWLPNFIVLLSTIVFLIGLNFSIEGVLIAEILGSIFMASVLFFRMRFYRHFSFSLNIPMIKSLLGLGVAYAVSLLVLNLNYRIDVVILDWLSNPFQIGIYSKGAVLSQYLWEVPMLLGTIVFARGARAKDRKLFSLKVSQLLRVSLIIIGAGSCLLAFLAKPIILLMFGADFLPSVSVMIWLLPGVLLLTIFKVLNMDMGGQGKPWFALKSMIPALVVNVILNLLVVPSYGALGAAFSSTVSYSFGAILFLVQYSKATQIPLREIFKFSKGDFSFATPYVNKLRHLVRL